MTWTELALILTAIGTFIGIPGVYFKLRADNRGIDADTIGKYQKLLDQSAEREVLLTNKLSKQAEDNGVNIEKLKEEIAQLKEKIQELMNYKDYAEILYKQVKMCGGTPMKIEEFLKWNGYKGKEKNVE
jgi:hypothetical protein